MAPEKWQALLTKSFSLFQKTGQGVDRYQAAVDKMLDVPQPGAVCVFNSDPPGEHA